MDLASQRAEGNSIGFGKEGRQFVVSAARFYEIRGHRLGVAFDIGRIDTMAFPECSIVADQGRAIGWRARANSLDHGLATPTDLGRSHADTTGQYLRLD
ncbi:hypothetical protein NKI94_04940 [Mesorhizobium australicum]|uniref:hypothetical protein n=1 Tax=Mesorhizobium australicum TaxID=536018 RepID=UPI0033397872